LRGKKRDDEDRKSLQEEGRPTKREADNEASKREGE
jgi:hypothetical protein